jgi:3'-phosphoadenosine 5'-phosphosulfate sulfotransferase (PAPS reductase)/FAD synthetase
MNLNKKIDKALLLIEDVLSTYKKPVIMSSFGKDSMVMIDLIRKVNKNVPCISHKEPFYPKKYEFANKVIENLELTNYDFPPCGTAIQQKENEIEIVNYYNCGDKVYMLPTGVIEPDYNRPYLCGFIDLFLKPTGTFNYVWDCCFVGHKSSDEDIFFDSLELKVDKTKLSNTTDIIFPLRYFTDNDIWEYTDKFNVMWNDKRYDRGQSPEKETFRHQFKDMTYNPDYFEACTKCMNKTESEQIFCPKFKHLVQNISSKLPYQEALKLNYLQCVP